MFQTLAGLIPEMSMRKGASMLKLHCGHIKRKKWSGKMRHFCAWCASGTLAVKDWKPQAPHILHGNKK